MIFRTFSIVNFSAEISNIIFNLKEFLWNLKIIICERDDIKKNISIEQVRTNSTFKRIVLSFFNEETTIMRRIINYDCQEISINVKKNHHTKLTEKHHSKEKT